MSSRKPSKTPRRSRLRAAVILFMHGYEPRQVARLVGVSSRHLFDAIRRGAYVLALALLLPARVSAQITVPNTFVNGTPADATLVNANFAALGANALNLTGGTMTGTLTTRAVTPVTDATYAIGDNTHRYTNAWLSGTLSVVGTSTLGAVNFQATNTTDIGAVGSVPRDLYYGRNAIGPAEVDDGNSGAAKTITFSSSGALHKVTRNANTTITLAGPPSPGFYQIRFIHDATANVYTVAFSPTPKFPGAVAPTFTNTTGAVDIVTLYWDGAAWWGQGVSNWS